MSLLSQRQLDYIAQKANKLGAKGIQVLSVIEPQSATSGEFNFIFITQEPEPRRATDKAWYDE